MAIRKICQLEKSNHLTVSDTYTLFKVANNIFVPFKFGFNINKYGNKLKLIINNSIVLCLNLKSNHEKILLTRSLTRYENLLDKL